MADDNRNTENFALGIIIAAIIFLFLRREFEKIKGGCGCGGGTETPGDARNEGAGCGQCPDGCNASSALTLPINPGITPGAILGNGGGRLQMTAGGGGGGRTPGFGIFGGYDYSSSAASANIFGR